MKKASPLFSIGIFVIFASAAYGWHLRAGHHNPPSTLCLNGCILTYHYDPTRQGVNAQETVLKASTLASAGFGFRNSVQVDGQVYAQPLYMSGINGPFSPTHNAVFIATEHGSVYAFEDDSLSLLQTMSLVPAGEVPVPQSALPVDPDTGKPCSNITYEVGITSTPVIDAAPPTPSQDPVLFAVVKTQTPGDPPTYHQRIHAWDPIANTDVSFDIGAALGANFLPLFENQRAGLALTHDNNKNAYIYVEWSAHCDSNVNGAYHGWIAAIKFDYSTQQFSLNGHLVDEPARRGSDGGIWMSGAAPAIDIGSGNLYLATANGAVNPGKSYGESVIRLKADPTAGSLSVNGSYTVNAWKTLNQGGMLTLPPPDTRGVVTFPPDIDLGAGGVVLVYPSGQTGFSGPFEVLAAGKEGVVYVLDPAHMGTGSNPPDVMDPCDTAPPNGYARQCFSGFILPGGSMIPDGTGLVQYRHFGVEITARESTSICCIRLAAATGNCVTGRCQPAEMLPSAQ